MPNIYKNANLNKNELQNAVVQPLEAAPLNANEGQIYYNTTLHKTFQYKKISDSPAAYDWVALSDEFDTAQVSTLGIDSTPTNNSSNLVTSGGVYTAINNIDALPDQTNNNGKYLKTNGTAASWENAPVTSVNGKTGAVSLTASDVDALPDTTTIPQGTVTSVQVQAEAPLTSTTNTAQSTSLNTTIKFSNQNAHTVLAGPTSGSADAPGFRALGADDIPTIPASKVTGALTSESDPVFSASAAANITATDISNWNNKQPSIGTISGLLKADGAGNISAAEANGDYQIPLVSGVDYAPASHSHGNITAIGAISTDVTIASGDKIVVIDASDSNKVARASISFDGSTTTKFLSQKGTWEEADDTQVTQTKGTYSSYTYWRPLINGSSSSSNAVNAFSTTTNTAYTFDNLRYQPSTGTLRTHIYNIAPTAAGTTGSNNQMSSDSTYNIYFRVNNGVDTVMTLYSNGTDMYVRPGGTYHDKVDLGKNTTRWKSLYLTEDVNLNNTSKITFADNVYGYYKSADGKFYTTYSSGTYSGLITGELGKVYIDRNTTDVYYWNGSEYALLVDNDVYGFFYGLQMSTPTHTQLKLDGYDTLGTRSDVVVRGVATPTADNDAANKAYVDTASSSLGHSLTFGDASDPLYSYNGSSAVNVPIYDGDGSDTSTSNSGIFTILVSSGYDGYTADKTTAQIIAAITARQPICINCYTNNDTYVSGMANRQASCIDGSTLYNFGLDIVHLSPQWDGGWSSGGEETYQIDYLSVYKDDYGDTWYVDEWTRQITTTDTSGSEPIEDW